MSQPLNLPLADGPFIDDVTKNLDDDGHHSVEPQRSFRPLGANAASAFVRRCSQGTAPDHILLRALEEMLQGKDRIVAKRKDLLGEGDHTEHLFIVVDGWGCRYKSTSDGARQIVGFLIPGDICNPEHMHGTHDPERGNGVLSSYAVGAITQLTLAPFRLDVAEKLIEREQRISRLIWSDVARMSDRERNWLLNIGQRDAMISVAHLLCELIERLDSVGLLRGGACVFPITQNDVAAATGLSGVHVNRTFGELRRRGLISFKGRALVVNDRAGLELSCLFEPTVCGRTFDARVLCHKG